MCLDKRVWAVVSHGKFLRVPGLASFYRTVGSAESMIQNKQVEAAITGTSPPIVAIIPFTGEGGRREGDGNQAISHFLIMSGSTYAVPVPVPT